MGLQAMKRLMILLCFSENFTNNCVFIKVANTVCLNNDIIRYKNSPEGYDYFLLGLAGLPELNFLKVLNFIIFSKQSVRNVCLSVILEFCLWSVVCRLSSIFETV